MTNKTRIPLIAVIALLVTWFVAGVASANPLPAPPPAKSCDECLHRCYSCSRQDFSGGYPYECADCTSLCRGKESALKKHCEKEALRAVCEHCQYKCYDCFNHKLMSKKEYGDQYNEDKCAQCENANCDSYYKKNCASAPKCSTLLEYYYCDTKFEEAINWHFPMWIPDSVRDDCVRKQGMDKRCAETMELALSCLNDYDCKTGGWKNDPEDENCVKNWNDLKKLYDVKHHCDEEARAETAELGTICFESYDCETHDWKKWPTALDERCIGRLRELEKIHDFAGKCKNQ